jgi:hypothetical protein
MVRGIRKIAVGGAALGMLLALGTGSPASAGPIILDRSR